jgi:hypothetical protein
VRQDLGFQSIQEIDFGDVFKGCSFARRSWPAARRWGRARPP